jgi:hypothetical protein
MLKRLLNTRGCYAAEPIIPDEREVAEHWRALAHEGDLPAEAPLDFERRERDPWLNEEDREGFHARASERRAA